MTKHDDPLFQAAIMHLKDAMAMFKEIERNRQMPPFAQTQAQYVAKGREIEKFLATLK